VDTFSNLNFRRWYVSDGWSNGPYQGCTWSADNVKIKDGALELTLAAEVRSSGYSCGEVQSREFYGYGTYEVRMQAAAGPGLVSAFFSYTGPPHNNPHDELDFEFLGKSPGSVQLNYYAGGQGNNETTPALGFDSSTTMADYAFQWLPDTIRWFINGQLVREQRRAEARPFPSNPSKIYISLWNGQGKDNEAWLKPFSYPGAPLVARYERIAFTAMGAPCQFPSSVVCTSPGGATPK
jgi:endo-1,3-1,4-beta-glycanase ExoK